MNNVERSLWNMKQGCGFPSQYRQGILKFGPLDGDVRCLRFRSFQNSLGLPGYLAHYYPVLRVPRHKCRNPSGTHPAEPIQTPDTLLES